MNKKILYIDMDNVLVDFPTGISRLPEGVKKEFDGKLDEVPSIFSLMKPMPQAVESFEILSGLFDTYILSTAPWENPSAKEYRKRNASGAVYDDPRVTLPVLLQGINRQLIFRR